eukprot:1880918-Alexandrium_andersonii.AAC.1
MTLGLTPPEDLTSGATTALRRTRVAPLRALPMPHERRPLREELRAALVQRDELEVGVAEARRTR